VRYLFLLLLFTSCEARIDRLELKLPYEFGAITFENHLQFDWEFEWLDYSDMAYLQERKVRFAKSNYEPLCESGFLWNNYPPDSVYQMTLTSYTEDSKKVYDADNPNWGYNKLYTFKKRFRKTFIRNTNIELIDSTYLDWLGHKGYSITYQNKSDSNKPFLFKSFLIDTEISHIKLLFECSGSNCDNFIEAVDKTVNSMRLTQ